MAHHTIKCTPRQLRQPHRLPRLLNRRHSASMAPATALEALQAQLRACRVPPLPPAAAAGSPQHLLPLLSHLLLAFSKHVARSVAEHGLQV